MALYAFAATITASDAVNLSRSTTLKNTIGTPTGNLEAAVDTERLAAVVYLAAPIPSNLAGLQAQERKTEQAQSGFKAAAAATLNGSPGSQERQAIDALLAQSAGLTSLRSQIASLSISRPQAIAAYANVVAAADTVLNDTILQETNVTLVTQSLALVRAGRSEELLLEEDSLINGDAIAHTFSAADRQQFALLAGARRTIYAESLPDMQPVYRAYYLKDISPKASAELTQMEDQVIGDAHPGRVPPVSLPNWNLAVGAVSAGLLNASYQAATEVTTRAQPVADATFLRLFLVGGLGLLAVILSIIVSVWIGRGLLQQLAALRRSALDLANKRLPSVVQRLRAGQEVDVSAEAPPLEASGDEIGQVREAFNAVQRTAVEAAVDEARLRRGVSDVFRNLARRSQSLLHRQLALLDTMERRSSDPEELENLFRIDHLTTRMRRHSEGLIILSGESPGRGWRHPVPFVDVLRAAVAEVEDYSRIRVTTGSRAALIGPAVADVIHMIAELAENATIFSPPTSPVRIHGDLVGRGYAIEIEDRGLGIPPEKLAEINHNFAHPPQFDLSGSERLGLFVAGQLAIRHDIRITVQGSPFGGTTAIVLIPTALVVAEGSYKAEVSAPPGDRAIRITSRQAALARGMPEPAALTRAGALATAGEPPGPETELPPRPAQTGLPSGAVAADLPLRPVAADLPVRPVAADLPVRPVAADFPVRPVAADLPVRPELADLPSRPEPADLPFRSEATDLPPGDTAPPAPAAQAGAEPYNVFTPRRRQPTTVPGTVFTLGGEPPTNADGPEADSRVTTADVTAMGLPVRVRQASLAAQLRDGGPDGADADESTPSAPSPEVARSTMTALQRGWERGRYITGTVTPPPGATLNTDSSSGESGEQQSDE
ncbi:MAG TPA: nitrate- and nitrite sensing domain-containing protein [Streptosporangiaceae bacterium]|nr:nitrate- and nitrite sensing domain-containing protein [Streptosporangiaceae bacterium]